MADMELVIKLSEKVYNVVTHKEFDANLVVNEMRKSIAEGTPLPKGHGRLIDADELKKVYDEHITDLYALNKKDNPSRESKIYATNWCSNSIDDAPIIIEADLCDSCKYQNEIDGSNCYECVKGIRNNYTTKSEVE